jgi:hypothetical protein
LSHLVGRIHGHEVAFVVLLVEHTDIIIAGLGFGAAFAKVAGGLVPYIFVVSFEDALFLLAFSLLLVKVELHLLLNRHRGDVLGEAQQHWFRETFAWLAAGG